MLLCSFYHIRWGVWIVLLRTTGAPLPFLCGQPSVGVLMSSSASWFGFCSRNLGDALLNVVFWVDYFLNQHLSRPAGGDIALTVTRCLLLRRAQKKRFTKHWNCHNCHNFNSHDVGVGITLQHSVPRYFNMASEEEREVVRVKVKVGSLKQDFSLC